MTDFSFIRNDTLRSVIERDYAELQGLKTDRATKAIVVLSGSILEGLLIDALTVAGKWDFDSACQQNLSSMIKPAKAKRIIQHDNLSLVVKEYRHLVHPGREVKMRIPLTKDQAELAKAAVNVTIQDISRWYETPAGKAAIELKLPTATVPPEQQSTFLRATDRSIDVRIDAASRGTFLILVTNHSDEAFDIAGAVVEFEGATLGTVARPLPGITWTVAAGKALNVRWPEHSSVMSDFVRRIGKYESSSPPRPIDVVFDCNLDDEHREIRKRVVMQVDSINMRGVQL